LKSHKHPSPLVYLKDVEAKNMELLLDYMYSGELMLKQDELENFLKTGQELGVKGLAVISGNKENSNTQNEANPCRDNELFQKLAKESPIPEASFLWETVKMSSPVKMSGLTTNSLLVEEQSTKCGDSQTLVKSEEFDVAPNCQIDEWKDLKNYVVVQKGKSGGSNQRRAKSLYKCSLCEKIMNHIEAMMIHIESKHFRDALTHTCQVCGKTFETRAIMNWHKQKEHKSKSENI